MLMPHVSDNNSLILAATSELVNRLWFAVIKRLGVGLVDVHTVAAASTHQTATRTELFHSFESATNLTDVSRLFLALLLGKKLFRCRQSAIRKGSERVRIF